MDTARFMEMVEEFKTLPPMHEIARTQVLLPGDKGYPKRDAKTSKKIVDGAIADAGKEPEWMRQRRLKEERKRANGRR